MPDLVRAPVVPKRQADDVPLCLHDGTPVWLRSIEPAEHCEERAEIAAEDAHGRVVGRAAYRRVYGPRAALTLEVQDAFWQLGLPAALLGRVGARAVSGGIATFLIGVAASDARLLALLMDDFAALSSREGSRVDVQFRTTTQHDH